MPKQRSTSTTAVPQTTATSTAAQTTALQTATQTAAAQTTALQTATQTAAVQTTALQTAAQSNTFFQWIKKRDYHLMDVLTVLAAIVGTWFVWKQNTLLGNQNQLIQHQMSLEEASRRGALIALMSNIMDKVDDEIKDQKDESLKKGVSRATVDTMKFSLSQSLIGQIAALSHSFKPYRFLDADTLIDKPLSPERGQLLITLTLLPLDTNTFAKIYTSSTFENADLQGANLYDANLGGADLGGANLRKAYLSDANLNKANLTLADLWDVRLTNTNLNGADLTMVNLKKAKLIGTKLIGTDLTLADLTSVDLTTANLTKANLAYAFLDNADLSIAQASHVTSLYECTGIHDSIRTILMNSHPQLFEEPNE